MCETIDDDKKAQTCAGLPEDWRFLFTAGDEKSKDMGLVLIAPDGQRFKGIELAQQAFPRSKFDEKSIRTSLGLYPLTEFSSSFGDDQSLGDDDNDSTLTLIELWRNRCHDCHNCNREDCKRCAACLKNERGKSKACCLRRVCERILFYGLFLLFLSNSSHDCSPHALFFLFHHCNSFVVRYQATKRLNRHRTFHVVGNITLTL